MGDIYTEQEIMGKGNVWGEWTFALSQDELTTRLSSLPKPSVVSKEDEDWEKLFFLLKQGEDISCDEDIPMECSSISINADCDPGEGDHVIEHSVSDLSVCLVDSCMQAASKLKSGLKTVQDEMKSTTEELGKLNKNALILVINSAWSELTSDLSRLCFCLPFMSTTNMCETLCQTVLLPWLKKCAPSKIELLSSILSLQGETVSETLIVPLLLEEDSLFVKDLMNLEDLMDSMSKKQWTRVLSAFLPHLEEIQSWNIAALAMIVEHSSPSVEDVQVLVQLMMSAGTSFAQNRDFGTLLVAVVKCIKGNSNLVVLVPQYMLICNNYKGPLQFKALNILREIE